MEDGETANKTGQVCLEVLYLHAIHDWNPFSSDWLVLLVINRCLTMYSTRWWIRSELVRRKAVARTDERKGERVERGREYRRSKLWMATPLMEQKEATGGEVQEGRLINGAAPDHFPWLYTFSPCLRAPLFPASRLLLSFWLVFF